MEACDASNIFTTFRPISILEGLVSLFLIFFSNEHKEECKGLINICGEMTQ